ncbi:protein GET1 isoform X2 [Mercurialis annua]|uniref:protein GET1 isoform X2 n=1 Tax=Mercurialis annua TaxID=3986 RepID=UPI0021603F98|nr:protein GET1 isoform X2 [Mercurialis annua]
MGEEEQTLEQGRSSLAAPLIFLTVICFQLISARLELLKKRAAKSATEVQLRAEIKQLLKEASSYSQPSTFALAAKLRRLAAAKEKELANRQEMHMKEMKLSYDLYLRVTFGLKIVTYFLMICWFWRTPVAAISQQLVQPFGRLLSWGAGGHFNDNILVGIIPWLVLSTRVSKFVCRVVQ